MNAKRIAKRKSVKQGTAITPTKPEKTVAEEVGFKLQQPIQTALHAKLFRLGYSA